MAAGDHWKAGLMMPAILRKVDHIVLMPRCARHVLAGSTLGLKAAVGYWRTDTRLEYHRDAATLHEKTAEANTARTLIAKQRLVVSAAEKILATFGPDKGYVHQPDCGLIIASESVVAMTWCPWLGFWKTGATCRPIRRTVFWTAVRWWPESPTPGSPANWGIGAGLRLRPIGQERPRDRLG